MRIALVHYDLPKSAKLGNVAPFMWRLGVAVNKSVWYLPEQNVPRVPIAEWRKRGAKVSARFFSESEQEGLMQECRDSLSAAIMETMERLEQSLATIQGEYEAVATGDYETAKEVHMKASRHVRAAKTFLANAQECSVTFMLMGDVKLLFDALRESIRAKDSLYYAMYHQKKTGLVPLPAPVGAPVENEAAALLAKEPEHV